MTTPAQTITATLPTVPIAVSAAPTLAPFVAPLPTAPLNIVDGSRVPVIPPFVSAAFSVTGGANLAATPGAPAPGSASGSGSLTATLTSSQRYAALLGGTGSATARTALTGTVIASASFGGISSTSAADAVFIGTTSLSAQTVPGATTSAVFYGGGSTTAIPPINIGPTPFAGSGALSATATGSVNLKPAGMTKNGNQMASYVQGTWIQITGWTADTTNYPGSVVTSDALICQGGKSSATITANASWADGTVPHSIQIRLKQNGTIIATGPASTASPGTATVTVTAPVANGDKITLEVADGNTAGNTNQATVIGGTNTYVRVS